MPRMAVPPPVRAALAAAFQAVLARGHSWVACTDYRGDVNFFEQDRCLAFPRRWDNRGGATAEIANGHQIAIDTGRDHQPPGACDIAMATPDWRGGYSSEFPFAVYEQGRVYCLAWPMKNHAAASCTNPFIPDTSLTLLVSSADPAADPTQGELNGRNINELAGLAANCDPAAPGSREDADECQLGLEKHRSGQVDCKGFQRSPKFCFNTDRAMGTGCFRVPGDMAPGHYVGQWYWEFNRGSPYTSCFDFQVVAPGAPEARGGTPGTTGTPDTSELPCTNNVLRFAAEPPPATTATAPATTSTTRTLATVTLRTVTLAPTTTVAATTTTTTTTSATTMTLAATSTTAAATTTTTTTTSAATTTTLTATSTTAAATTTTTTTTSATTTTTTPATTTTTAAATTTATTTTSVTTTTLATTTTTTTSATTTTTTTTSATTTTTTLATTSTTAVPTTTATTTTSTTAAPTTTATTATPSTSFLATTTSTRTVGVVAGQCPQSGRGLPAHVSDCFCAFAGVGGAGCSEFPDDGSACWCRCCCHFRGNCTYKEPGGGIQGTLALTQVSYVASLAAAVAGGCSAGVLATLCFACCFWAAKSRK